MKDRDQDGYYSLLGVSPQATPSEIETAYRAVLAAAEGPGLEFVRKAAEQAYAVLSNDAARQTYDPAWSPPGVAARTSPDAMRPEVSTQQAPSGNTEAERPTAPQRAWVGSPDDETFAPSFSGRGGISPFPVRSHDLAAARNEDSLYPPPVARFMRCLGVVIFLIIFGLAFFLR
jgi:curved DNA-binding protein CbpA